MKQHLITVFFLIVYGMSTYGQAIDSAKLLTDFKILSSVEFAGRQPGTEGHEKAKQYLVNRFDSLGLKHFGKSYVDTFHVSSSLIGQNVTAYIPGKVEEAIVISGHYDHLGERRGKLHLGADDNASGAAALLSLAEYFSQQKTPYYTLIFISFDAEEMGLKGAKAFLDNPPIPREKIILNVNMDMISRNDNNELYAAGTFHYPHLLPYLDLIENDYVTLKTGHDDPKLGRNDWTNQSDQGVFHRHRIPFIYFGVEDHPDYHTPNDVFENTHPRFYYHATEIVLDFVRSFLIPLPGLEGRTPAKADLIMH